MEDRNRIMKRIVANEQVCMGCGLCEVYCTLQQSKSKDLVKAYNKEKPRPVSRVRLEVRKPISFAIQCRNCEDAPCVTACLSGAMKRDAETGLVVHDKERCIGCWTCVMVCPYGALKTDVSGKVVAKCDLCMELETPACVANCPNRALTVKQVKT
jgi:carbon-monoxide dehydrogenase iron sulfur subunit